MRRLLGLLIVAVLVSGCAVSWRPPRPILPVATRMPAPRPYPTLGPDEPSFDSAQDAWQTRALAVPPAPTLLGAPRTFVITVADDGLRWNGDVLLRWRHPAPPGVDYYEVRHGLNQPYTTGEREGTTTALRFLSDAPGQDFVYQSGTPGAAVAGDLDAWRIKACNRAGCSDPSNAIGVMTFSLRQGSAALPFH